MKLNPALNQENVCAFEICRAKVYRIHCLVSRLPFPSIRSSRHDCALLLKKVLSVLSILAGIMSPWIRVLEAYMVQALLRSPMFHRQVEKVAKGVHRIRHGIPPEEMGGTKIDSPGGQSGLFGHFLEEVKTQLGNETKSINGGSGQAGVNVDSRAMGHGGMKSQVEKKVAQVDEMNAEAAWKDAQQDVSQPPKQGFLGEYTDALRQQMGSGKKS